VKQHPTAIVDPQAEIAEDVEIGPFCIIHAGAELGPGTVLESHVVIHGSAGIGGGNRFHQGCAIGDLPQDFSFDGEPTRVVIGNNNTFREFCTVHRGTEGGAGISIIGNDNYFMAYSHIAHDCRVGNNTLFGNAGSLAGHVTVEDHATIGPFSGVHQHCTVGAHGWIGPWSVITKDVLPYSKTVGNRARIYGPNLLGLQRKGFSLEAIKNIRRAYRFLFQSKLNTSQALERIEAEIVGSPEVDYLVRFIRASKRGIIK
jgi:UDP-N-acetylglucosamine acyltransferase